MMVPSQVMDRLLEQTDCFSLDPSRADRWSHDEVDGHAAVDVHTVRCGACRPVSSRNTPAAASSGVGSRACPDWM